MQWLRLQRAITRDGIVAVVRRALRFWVRR